MTFLSQELVKLKKKKKKKKKHDCNNNGFCFSLLGKTSQNRIVF